jgi:predicted secreted protein
MATYSGQSGILTAGAFAASTESWTATGSNELADVTTTASGGWVNRIATVSSYELQGKGFYTGAAASTAIYQGAPITFSGIIGGSGQTLAGDFIISNVSFEVPAKGAVGYSFTAQSDGAVTIGGGG